MGAIAAQNPGAGTHPPTAEKATATAPLTESRKLTLQARALIDDDFLATRENYRLAEEFSRKATTLDPSDAEAWATFARVSLGMLERNYDTSAVRRDAARSQADRAMRLAPSSVEVGLAMATYQLQNDNARGAAEQFRQILGIAPNDARIVLGLAASLQRTGRLAEGSELRLTHPAFGGRDPRPLVDEAEEIRSTRLAESDVLLDRAQALAPTLGGYYLKLANFTSGWGDLEAGRAYLATIPASVVEQDGIAALAASLWIRLGNGDKALSVLRRVPRDYFQEFRREFPKGYLTGWAMQIAGRGAAARAEWTQALDVLDTRFTGDPNNTRYLLLKALLLSLVGRAEEADAVWKVGKELLGRQVGKPNSLQDAEMLVALGRREEAIAIFTNERRRKLIHWELNTLRYDPGFAPIRNDPRVQQIIKTGVAELEQLRQAATNSTAAAGPGSPTPAQPTAAQKSVAVLAFKNLSGDPAREFFSDGLSEAVTDVLGRVPGLKVVGSASAFSFKGKAVPIPEIAKQLGVTHLVDGTVIQDGSTVRITAKLIQADGFQVWVSDKLERAARNIFALHDEVAGLIAKNLSLKLGASSTAQMTVDPLAFELCLQARRAWNLRTPQGYDQAEEFLNKAIEREPRLARAHAQLSDVWLMRGGDLEPAGATFAWRDSETIRRVRERAELAVSLDPNSSEALTSLSNVAFMNWQMEESVAILRRAITLNPNYATARQWLGDSLAKLGRLEESLLETSRATEIEPLSFIIWNNHAQVLMSAGKLDAALAAFDRAQSLAPAAVQAGRARALSRLGRTAEAMAMINLPGERWNNRDMWKAEVLRRAGRESEAGRLVAEARPEQKFWGLLALGRQKEALEVVSLANFDLNSLVLYHALYDEMLDPIRSDARFLNILATLGLTEAHARAQAWRKANPPEKTKAKK